MHPWPPAPNPACTQERFAPLGLVPLAANAAAVRERVAAAVQRTRKQLGPSRINWAAVRLRKNFLYLALRPQVAQARRACTVRQRSQLATDCPGAMLPAAAAVPCCASPPAYMSPLPATPQVALVLGGTCGVMAVLLQRSWAEQARLAGQLAKRETDLARLVSTGCVWKGGLSMGLQLRTAAGGAHGPGEAFLPRPALDPCPAPAHPRCCTPKPPPCPPLSPPNPPCLTLPASPASSPQLSRVMELQGRITSHRGGPLIRHVSMPVANASTHSSPYWPAVIVV